VYQVGINKGKMVLIIVYIYVPTCAAHTRYSVCGPIANVMLVVSRCLNNAQVWDWGLLAGDKREESAIAVREHQMKTYTQCCICYIT